MISGTQNACCEPSYENSVLAFCSLTVLPGRDKAGNREQFESITLKPGDVVAVVGPTGSGKSRLLADIEWLARGDTPSGRCIQLDGRAVDKASRFRTEAHLVAQLSQSMTFMLDLAAGTFLLMHAESRGYSSPQAVVDEALDAANGLAGEQFTAKTPLSNLSGGQSRALMIADVAVLCRSPIVLLDEIENAGIDRRRALDLLLSKDKLVMLATHDPLLALHAPRRLIIGNGAVQRVVERTVTECELLSKLESMDQQLQAIRRRLRAGEALDNFQFRE